MQTSASETQKNHPTGYPTEFFLKTDIPTQPTDPTDATDPTNPTNPTNRRKKKKTDRSNWSEIIFFITYRNKNT